MELKLNNVRLAFPKLFHPEQVMNQGKAAFSAAFILPRDHPQIPDIVKAMKEVAVAKWKAEGQVMYDQLKAGDKLCLHNGDAKANVEGYAGNFYLGARSYIKPLVLDKDKKHLAEQDGKPYGGCYVNAIVEVWAQQNSNGKRINASLKGVQFLRDGDAFAGGVPAGDDDFDDISDTGAGEPAAAQPAASFF